MTFVFLAFAGFESAVPLAEETQNPRRTVPRAVLLATVIIGIFYMFCSYAGIVNWGVDKIASYATDPIYIATYISVPFYYWREQRAEFSVLRHIVLPIIPVLVLLAVIYSQVVPLLIPPYPAAPISYAVPIVVAWFIIGVIIVAILSARVPEALAKSSKVYAETEEL